MMITWGPMEHNYKPPSKEEANRRMDSIVDLSSEEELLALGERLMRDGVPRPQSNVDMLATHAWCNHERQERAYAQTFIDNFEELLEELRQWEPH